MGGFNWEIYMGNPKLIKKLKEEIRVLTERVEELERQHTK